MRFMLFAVLLLSGCATQQSLLVNENKVSISTNEIEQVVVDKLLERDQVPDMKVTYTITIGTDNVSVRLTEQPTNAALRSEMQDVIISYVQSQVSQSGHVTTLYGSFVLIGGVKADNKEAETLTPKTPYGFYLRGKLLSDQKKYKRAVEDFKKSLVAYPTWDDGYFEIAAAYHDAGLYEQAEVAYKKFITLNQKDAAAYLNLGMISTNLKKYDQADKYLAKALEIDPHYGRVFDQKARLALARKDYKQALKETKKGIAMLEKNLRETMMDQVKDGNNPIPSKRKLKTLNNLYYRQAVAQYSLNDFKNALKSIDQSIIYGPRDSWAYNKRGYIKDNLSDFKGALSDFDRSYKLNPSLTVALYNRGLMYQELGDCQKAMADYETYQKLEPKDELVYYQIGRCKFRSGEYQKAIASLNQAIHLKKDNHLFYLWRGKAYRMLGDSSKGQGDFKKVLAIRPDHKEAKRLMK